MAKDSFRASLLRINRIIHSISHSHPGENQTFVILASNGRLTFSLMSQT